MSNTSINSTSSPSSDLIQASIILPIMEKYITVILYIFGFIGSLLNIFIFLQKGFRIQSCSTYFLATSIVDFCYINSFMLMQLISLFNTKVFVSINATNLWCKMGNYFYFILPCLASTYITLASIDRFCVTSANDRLQKISQTKFSQTLVLTVFLIWALFSLHIPISYDRIQPTPTSSIQCTPNLELAAVFIILDGFFFSLYNGLIVPFFLTIFGLLIFHNVKRIHRQISITHHHPTNIHLTRTNQHLITMLLFQVCFTIILHIPYIVIYLYGIYNPIPSYPLALLVYIIFSYIGRWFWFMNFCKMFYVNTLASQTFRKILKQRIAHLILPVRTVHPQQHINVPPHRSNSSSSFD